jgi:hypothetical protein
MKLITTIDKRGLPFRTPAVEGQRTAETHATSAFRESGRGTPPRAPTPELFHRKERLLSDVSMTIMGRPCRGSSSSNGCDIPAHCSMTGAVGQQKCSSVRGRI